MRAGRYGRDRYSRRWLTALVPCLALLACATDPRGSEYDLPDGDLATVTFRVWDETAASAYQESFDAFNSTRRNIFVEVEYVPIAEYRERAAADLASGEMADIFWATPTDVADIWHSGHLLDISATLGDDLAEDEWEPSLVASFTHDETLWAVPQLWESSALYYNVEAVQAAGIDLSGLRWSPVPEPVEDDDDADAEEAGTDDDSDENSDATSDADADAEAADADDTETAPADDAAEETDGTEAESPQTESSEPPTDPGDGTPGVTPDPDADTLIPAAVALTRDEAGLSPEDEDFDAGNITQYGLGVWSDDPRAYAVPLAQNGVSLAPDGQIQLATSQGEETFDYLVDLIDTHRVAPSPELGDDATIDRFAAGELALFQGTSGQLKHLYTTADMTWAVAPGITGPMGQVSTVYAVAAVGYQNSAVPESTAEVLGWLGSPLGQIALAGHGVAFPAATSAQSVFIDYWSAREVDVTPFIDALRGTTVPGPDVTALGPELEAVRPVLDDLFAGLLEVPDALRLADEAAAEVHEG